MSDETGAGPRGPLRLATASPAPEPPAGGVVVPIIDAARVSYRFRRHKGRQGFWWLIEEHEGRGCRSIGNPPTAYRSKAAAREAARAHAQGRRVLYVEWTKPPPLTPEQEHEEEVHAIARRVHFCDRLAEEYEGRRDYQRAAQDWLFAAKACEDLTLKCPGESVYYGQCAASRIDEAIRCLGDLKTRYLSIRPSAALRVMKPPSEPKGVP